MSEQTPILLKPDREIHIDRGQGTASVLLTGVHTGSPAVTTGITIIPVGGSIPLHTHNVDETAMVLSGQAMVEFQDSSREVGMHEGAFVPMMYAHRFVNVGDEPLRLFWIYSGPRPTRTLIETGRTLDFLEPYPE